MRKALEDRYTVDREIGRGGAARVFLATDKQGKSIALKVLHPELLVSVAAERFLREIRMIQRLDHPNIAALLDSGERDWLVYYVMPYIEGPTLKQRLQQGALSLSETRILARQLLSALTHAHGSAIVHRDVKPDNILLAAEGAVLLDFGIARAVEVSASDRLTRSGIAVGTSSYMSPEQIAAQDDVDHRTDLYSVGCLLFECLAGRPPYHHTNENVVLRMHRLDPIPDVRQQRSDTPDDMVRAVSRAMAKDRDERWQTAEEMGAALARDES